MQSKCLLCQWPLADGLSLSTPGFCFNRLKDFECYVWSIFGTSDNYFGSNLESNFDVSYGVNEYDLSNDTNKSFGDYSLEYPSYEQPVEKVASDNISLYISPFLLFCGTFGNMLALVILLKLCTEVSSSCIYLAVLTVVDLLLLYTRCGNEWLAQVIHKDLSYMAMVYSQSICKVYPFLYNFMFHMSRWLLAALAIEGFIQTKYPHKAIHMCTLSRAKAVILLLTVLLVCINVHYFWSYEVVEVMQEQMYLKNFMCTFSKYSNQYSEEFGEVIWPLIDFLVAEVLPNIIIMSSTVCMMVLIISGRHKGSQSHQQWRSRYILDPSALDNFKYTYFVVILVHIPATLPSFILTITRYLMYKNSELDNMHESQFKIELARTVVNMLQYAFLSCKFFLYLACCNKFRLEFRRMTHYGCHNKVHNPSTPSSRPLMKKESMSSINTNSGQRWRNMENADRESPIMAARANNVEVV